MEIEQINGIYVNVCSYSICKTTPVTQLINSVNQPFVSIKCHKMPQVF